MTDELDTTGEDTRDTRRDALKKIGVGAAVAWSVPVIASSPALAGGSDAPFPPGDCPSCGTPNLVANGQFDSPFNATSPLWGATNAARDTYLNVFGDSNPLNWPTGNVNNLALLGTTSSSGSITQTLTISGGCAERTFALTYYGAASPTDAVLTATVETRVLPNGFSPSGSLITNGVAVTQVDNSFGFGPDTGDLRTINGVLPTAALTDTIEVRITFSVTAGQSHTGYIDAVRFVIGC